MPRYRVTLEYDGRPYVGWQRQPDGASVQGALEAAAARLIGAPCQVIGAGRTDAGVHARGQVAHFDLPKSFKPDTVRDGLNHFLRPQPIAVLEAACVDAAFHARFHATSREYRYVIVDRRAPLALEAGRAWRAYANLNHEAMQEAALALVGTHDFTTFRHAACQAKSPIKTLDTLTIERRGHRLHVAAQARSFLHRQVRSIVGTLVEAGRGAWRVSDVAAALAARDRSRCGPVAPPDGLYLMAVGYGDASPPAPLEAESLRDTGQPTIS